MCLCVYDVFVLYIIIQLLHCVNEVFSWAICVVYVHMCSCEEARDGCPLFTFCLILVRQGYLLSLELTDSSRLATLKATLVLNLTWGFSYILCVVSSRFCTWCKGSELSFLCLLKDLPLSPHQCLGGTKTSNSIHEFLYTSEPPCSWYW